MSVPVGSLSTNRGSAYRVEGSASRGQTPLAVDKNKIHTHFFLVTDELNRNGSSIHKNNGINLLHDDSQTLARVAGLKSALPK